MDIVNQEVTQLQIADQVIAEVNHKVTQIGAL